MSLIDFFLFNKNSTANIAKKRLSHIIIQDRKFIKNKKNFYSLNILKKDILEVIYKYIKVYPKFISMNLENKKKNCLILTFSMKIPKVKFYDKKII